LGVTINITAAESLSFFKQAEKRGGCQTPMGSRRIFKTSGVSLKNMFEGVKTFLEFSQGE
jgi:hypothetical protein